MKIKLFGDMPLDGLVTNFRRFGGFAGPRTTRKT